MAVLCTYFVLSVLLGSFTTASIDIDEINSIYYGLDILGSPIIKDKLSSDALLMVNRLGQEYACTLPTIPSELKSSGKDDFASQVESVDIAELLKPMEEAPCLLRKKDWWTYEFCYGQVIKQYHMEGGKSTGAVLILGRFESEYDWSTGGKGGADAATGRNSNRLQRFHSQYYTNGTKCDLTGEPRRSEVRFKCETDVGDYIERVDEPESCRYIVTIATTRVCHHPYLRPHPSRTPHQISCSPVLEEAKYKQYQLKQERKKKAIEEKARKAALAGDVTEDESDINIKLINFGSALKDVSSTFHGGALTVAPATDVVTAEASSSESPTKSAAKDDSEFVAKDNPESAAKDDPESATKDDSESVAKHDPESAVELYPESEAKHNPESATKHDSESAAKHDPESAVKHDPESAAKHDPESAVKHGSESAAKDDPESYPDTFSREWVGVGSVIEVPVIDDEDETEASDDEINASVVDDGKDAEKADVLEKEVKLGGGNEENESKAGEKLPRSETQLDKLIHRIGKHYTKMTNSDLVDASVGLNKLREQLSTGTEELQDLLEDTLSDLDQELGALSEMAETRGDQSKVQLWQNLADKVKKMREKSKLLGSSKKKEKEPEFGTDEWLQWRVRKNEKIIAKAQETLNSVGDMNKIMDAKMVAEAEKIVKEVVAAQSKDEKDDEDEDMIKLLSSKMVDEFIKEYLSDQDAGSKDDETKLGKNISKGKRGEAEKEVEDASVVISSLQQSIKNKIKEAGIDVNKHKIEVQILTPGAEFGGLEDTLSAEQAASVETLVVKLMGAQKEEIIEREKHETLNENYSFSFDEINEEDDEPVQPIESTTSEAPESDPSLDSSEYRTREETVAEHPISDSTVSSGSDGAKTAQSRDSGDAPPIRGAPLSDVVNEPAELIDGPDEGD
ncbi:Glucosidase II beta subunit-like [Trinorchestia longiramus]|nr:Glucosidase II beta subunit-like [Trinorchestia longiramus]